VIGVDRLQPAGREVERLLPRRLAEVRQHLLVVDQPSRLAPPTALAANVARQRALGVGALAADERYRQPLRVRRVVPPIAALHAQPAVVAGLLAAFGKGDRVALAVDVVGERAAHSAVRAHCLDRLELRARLDRHLVDWLVDEGAGRTCRDALAARHARGLAHRVVQVECDARGVALARAADDVVALDVVARPHAAVAEDAGVVVDRDHGVGEVLTPPAAPREVVLAHSVLVHEDEQLVVRRRRLLGVLLGRGLVDQQQPREHRALALDLLGGGLDVHAVLAWPHARRGQHAGADIDHAHAAHADRVVALVVAQDGNLDADVLRRVPDRRPLGDGDLATVDGQGDGLGLSGCRAGNRHAPSHSPRLGAKTHVPPSGPSQAPSHRPRWIPRTWGKGFPNRGNLPATVDKMEGGNSSAHRCSRRRCRSVPAASINPFIRT
jgi:hypothetical protein